MAHVENWELHIMGTFNKGTQSWYILACDILGTNENATIKAHMGLLHSCYIL